MGIPGFDGAVVVSCDKTEYLQEVQRQAHQDWVLRKKSWFARTSARFLVKCEYLDLEGGKLVEPSFKAKIKVELFEPGGVPAIGRHSIAKFGVAAVQQRCL